AGIEALIRARAGTLEGDGQARVAAAPRGPAQLDVAKEDHPGRPPVLDRVREDVGIHERAPRLAGADRAELAPGMTEAEGGLSRVDARAEELELEDRVQLAQIRGRP